MAVTERSYEPITDDDLRRLGAIAAADRVALFSRRTETGRLYANRLFAVALCQGAALHRLDGHNGVKDFDVWSFYVEDATRPYPYRRRGIADFGDAKFGTTAGCDHLIGRRVDLLGRSMPVAEGADVVKTLRRYLSLGETETARALAAKAMVLIEPQPLLGTVIWPAT